MKASHASRLASNAMIGHYTIRIFDPPIFVAVLSMPMPAAFRHLPRARQHSTPIICHSSASQLLLPHRLLLRRLGRPCQIVLLFALPRSVVHQLSLLQAQATCNWDFPWSSRGTIFVMDLTKLSWALMERQRFSAHQRVASIAKVTVSPLLSP